jgi:predicted cytidylate kinase
MDNPTIALSGELGSGKSSVAELLVDALGARRVSTGEAQRQIAAKRGISTLELNRLSETDPTIDEEIDSVFRSLAETKEPLVVDSRLAWHFLPLSFKVHLVVDPEVAAARVLHREGSQAERYESVAEALERIGARADSERRRFQVMYDLDIFRLGNYDLVIDTSRASPDEVARAVLDHLASPETTAGPAILLDPQRAELSDDEAIATSKGGGEGEAAAAGVPPHTEPLTVTYRRPTFTAVRGSEELAAARRIGATLVPAVLLAEEDLPISER